MGRLAADHQAYLYAIAGQQGLIRIGVAADPNERRRTMQFESPVPLELLFASHHFRAEDADAVLEDLKRQLSAQHAYGSWYRASPEEVRRALGNRSACQAPREAAEAREAASEPQAEAEQQRKGRQSERRRSRAEQRREKLRAAAALFAADKKQVEVARELRKNVRTIRRWQQLTGFEAELAKAKLQQARAAEREQRQAERRRERRARRRLARSDPHRYEQLYGAASSRSSPLPGGQPLPLAPAGGRVMQVMYW
jgi:hypothetical protein